MGEPIFTPQAIETAREANPFAKISDLIYRELELAIFSSRLSPGQRLSVQKLAEEFNVSPTPVREAIGRLLEAGLVTTGSDANRKRNNYYVFDISDDQIEDLFAVRSAMEGCATFLCAQNGSGRDYSELKALANSFRTRLHSLVYDPESYSNPWQTSELDRGFHKMIVEYSGNSFLKQLYESINERLDYLSVRTNQFIYWSHHKKAMLQLGEQHMEIYRAVKLGFPEVSRNAAMRHVDFCRELCLRSRRGNCIGSE